MLCGDVTAYVQGQEGLTSVGQESMSQAKAVDAATADRIVLEYLRKRGYRRAEEAMMAGAGVGAELEVAVEDAMVDDDLRNVVMMLGRPADLAANDARRFDDSYCELRDWVDGSLDLYKAELHSVLYPMLVHCFLEVVKRELPDQAREFLERCSAEFREDAGASGATGRREELLSLAGIASPQHLEENKTAALFLSNRYELHLSSYAFELIISFLADDPRRAVLLRILNQRCRVHLDADAEVAARAGGGEPTSAATTADEGKGGGFLSAAERTGLLRHEVLWGRLRREHYMIPDADEGDGAAGGGGKDGPGKADKGDSKRAGGDKKNATASAGADAKGKAASELPSGGGSGVDKSGAGADGTSGADDSSDLPGVREDGTLSESRIPLKKYRISAQGLETAGDVRARASLGPRLGDAAAECVLPSVLCYTFTNTKGDGLNCSAVSMDGSQVAGGFGDSTVRIWDAKGSGSDGSGGLGGRAARLVGHSGPVYSVDWTNCGRFILSGSEDGTVRLWNAAMRTDLVAYRGHNYPVWCVGFAPLGHYFASGSHDRTGRIWCTDRIYPLRILAGHLADVDTLRWHPNCNYVATGSSDRTARLWDVREGKCVRVFSGQGGTVHALAFSRDGRTLAVGGDGRDIQVWDIASGRRMAVLKGHESSVWSLDYSREGSVLASGSADCSVGLWRAGWATTVPSDDGVSVDGEVEQPAGAKVAQDAMDGVTTPATDAADAAQPDSAPASGSPPTPSSATTAAAVVAASVPTPQTAPKIKRTHEGIDSCDWGKMEAKLRTKSTPIHGVTFTRRNVLIVAGSYGAA